MFEIVNPEPSSLVGDIKKMTTRFRRQSKSFFCTIINGGHELYRARTDTKLYQECLLCGHKTEGWVIDRRDRRGMVSSGQAHV